MRSFCAVLLAGLLSSSAAHAAVVSVGDSSTTWLGFMNVSELPSNGGGFVFGSSWGVPDLTATFDDANHKLTLSPNTVGDPNPFWYTPAGGPGATGNKIMEANLYVETNGGVLGGQTVTFQGTILADTLASSHHSFIFIKDFAPDYSSSVSMTIPITAAGAFSISLATINDPARHVQYGFQTIGADVWITDTAPFGNVMIGTVPAPASMALLGLGGTMLLRRRR